MRYSNIQKGSFIERPNRFIAYIDIEGRRETVHVKNTGRCAELLTPGASVYVQESDNPARKTRWDLIAAEKGERMVNMDSQVPNRLVREWLEEGHLFEEITGIRPEYTYGSSRFDLYVEADGKKIFIEVKGVTLEEDGVVRFPDAPSARAVKHVEELKEAVKEGYEAYVFFVVQMKGVRYFTPNMDTHPAFGEALLDASEAGVHVLAYDCEVKKDYIHIEDEVPVALGDMTPGVKECGSGEHAVKAGSVGERVPNEEGDESREHAAKAGSVGERVLDEEGDEPREHAVKAGSFREQVPNEEGDESREHAAKAGSVGDCAPGEVGWCKAVARADADGLTQGNKLGEVIVEWYRDHKRDLPWRRNADAYRVWVSEIMLQQTRVEAVKSYYERFLKELPTVKDLAEAGEDKLLKLWEGLGYYNRVRNMQKAAQQVMMDYHGVFPDTYEEIRSLKGIGNYTAGAISAFAYGIPEPAVDGNVLRVISRLTGSREDIAKQSVRKKIEDLLKPLIPEDAAGDFNQGLIELGAIVCVPNGEPKCGECPLYDFCEAGKRGLVSEIPVKSRGKARKVEERTVFLFKDGKRLAIRKRPPKGLLASLYEFPNVEGRMCMEEAAAYSKEIGLSPVRIKELGGAKHIFSHIEWHMTGYEVIVDELEQTNAEGFLFIMAEEIGAEYPVPSAFEYYKRYAGIM